ncbi:MAG TPA: PIN domain-containing protein [Anaerolineales bacterium]|jgi:predicted nucleic acid-binding protein
MSTFVDTSALLAILDADDDNHPSAKVEWERLIAQEETLLTTNYVLVESFALVQHRLGMEAVRTLHEDILPLINVEWMEAQSHYASVMALITAGRRELSLVDCASFEAMRRLGITTALAFDRHFREQGFAAIP